MLNFYEINDSNNTLKKMVRTGVLKETDLLNIAIDGRENFIFEHITVKTLTRTRKFSVSASVFASMEIYHMHLFYNEDLDMPVYDITLKTPSI